MQMKSLKIYKTRKEEDQLVPPTAHLKCVGAFQIRRKVRWNGAILISRAISIIYKFYNCDCSNTKIIKLNQVYLYDIYTKWSYLNSLLKVWLDFYSVYGLNKWKSKYENQKSKNLPVLFVSNWVQVYRYLLKTFPD